MKTLATFYKILAVDPAKAFYGYEYVIKASNQGAIDTLMVPPRRSNVKVSDALFRSQSAEERKKYISLVDETRKNGGTALIFSSLHTSGEQLTQLTGIACILHFPMPELEDEVAAEIDAKNTAASLIRPGDADVESDVEVEGM